jgi:ribonuclease HI
VLIATDDRIEFCYRLGDARTYRAGERNVEIVPDGQVVTEPSELVQRHARRRRATLRQRKGAHTEDDPLDLIVAYTDGACEGNPGPAGVGVVLVDRQQVRELSHFLGHATNNIAELTAIEMALESIGQTDRKIRLYTDSEYAIGVLTLGWKARANQELVGRLRKLVDALPGLELIHVRGHSGVPMNERADRLAVKAVKTRASAGWTEGELSELS